MADVGSFQVVVDPGVSCKLTLKLKEVPWDTALDIALRVCGLGSESENGIVRVAPVAKLTAENAERRKLAEEQKQSAVLVQRIAEIEPAVASAHHLEIKLAEEQKRSAVLVERLAEIEPAAARAEKLADIIEEIVKLGPKSRR